MEVINLGAADGLPPVSWDVVTEKLAAGSAPAPDAHNARTTWLATINEDGSPHVTAVGAKPAPAPARVATSSATRVARSPSRSATPMSSSKVTQHE